MLDLTGTKRKMITEIGFELTKHFKNRYTQIKSFSNFGEFCKARLDHTERLQGDLDKCFSMTLTKNFRIIVSPCTNDLSIENLLKIDTFKIIGVIDYHGEGKNKNKWLIN